MSEGFDQMYEDLHNPTRVFPRLREDELKAAVEDCLQRNETVQELMQNPEEGESAEGSLAIINQSMIEQTINEAVSYQLSRLVRLEEYGIHGPRYTKRLVGLNGSKAEQSYFKSFQKLMQTTSIKIGHDFDLTTDLKPPTSLRFKAKIIQDM